MANSSETVSPLTMTSTNSVRVEKTFTADQIDDHIWLGDIDSAENHQALDALQITHILTVLDYEPTRQPDDRRIRKYVQACDLHTVDLSEEFESCFQFIEEAVSKKQNVLIHCHAGMSRSATIACAYLMKKHRLSFHTAVEQVRSKRPCVYPNQGFEKQLRHYHAKNYELKPQRPKAGSDLAEDNFDDVVPNSVNDASTIEYKCKLCRQVLFNDADLLTHIMGKGRFDYYAKSSAYKAKQNADGKEIDICRQELFTSQPEWLTDIFGKDTNNGEIECPNSKCQNKLGRYSLVGEKCTCAKWVNPAFHFHRSKVDECSTVKNPEIERLLLQRTAV